MAERLYGIACDYAGLGGSERVYDLFCGIGTLSLTLALRAAEVWAVEISEEAVADAIRNAERNEIENVHFFAGDVRDAVRPARGTARRARTSWWSTRRAPGSPRRWCARLLETRPAAHRLRFVQSDHARPERGPDGRGRLPPR